MDSATLPSLFWHLIALLYDTIQTDLLEMQRSFRNETRRKRPLMDIKIDDKLLTKIWQNRTDKKQTLDQRINELLESAIKQKCPKCDLIIYKCSECGTPLICPDCDAIPEDVEDEE
jgi:predicted RNA-binding Zn-ribbon protein involved in translation (DUF1610 family)